MEAGIGHAHTLSETQVIHGDFRTLGHLGIDQSSNALPPPGKELTHQCCIWHPQVHGLLEMKVRLLGSVGVWAFKGPTRFVFLSCVVLHTEYRGTSLISCGDFENACSYLKKTRNFSKNGGLFLRRLTNFPKNGCLFLIFFRPLPLGDVVSDQK